MLPIALTFVELRQRTICANESNLKKKVKLIGL